jgi:hypothetical protein
MIAKTYKDLPTVYKCRICSTEKEIEEMILIHRKKTNDYMLRPRCKACHNKSERGHRREYKTNYLRKWRTNNSGLNESYWRTSTQTNRDEIADQARARFNKDHYAILIQGRINRRTEKTGMHITIDEARALLRKYGRCYPTRFGLTPKGLKECERIRSGMRRIKRKMSLLEIRIMVYEDGYYIKPKNQPIIYKSASERLHHWHRERGHKLAA